MSGEAVPLKRFPTCEGGGKRIQLKLHLLGETSIIPQRLCFMFDKSSLYRIEALPFQPVGLRGSRAGGNDNTENSNLKRGGGREHSKL